MLLLRDQGYDCEYGETFYAQTQQRVVVEPTGDLLVRTLAAVEQAREAAVRLRPPPPLESSPKCPRCPLVGICLPDETNVLGGWTASPGG